MANEHFPLRQISLSILNYIIFSVPRTQLFPIQMLLSEKLSDFCSLHQTPLINLFLSSILHSKDPHTFKIHSKDFNAWLLVIPYFLFSSQGDDFFHLFARKKKKRGKVKCTLYFWGKLMISLRKEEVELSSVKKYFWVGDVEYKRVVKKDGK